LSAFPISNEKIDFFGLMPKELRKITPHYKLGDFIYLRASFALAANNAILHF
jgi:hypothetical protein